MNTEEGIWVPGYGDLTSEVMEVLLNADAARRYLALKEMRDMASAGGERYHLGTGEVKMMIHPVSYHYWGQRLGYDCWSDKQFCDEYLRDNDYARVKSRARNAMIGWTPAMQGQGAADNYVKRTGKLFLKAA